jgi:hypothetical protein
MVHKVTMLINSLPKQNGIHSILSPREIVTRKKFRCPSIKIGQYVQGHTGRSNSTDKERSVDALYIGCADNGSGHTVFKLHTKQPISVNSSPAIMPLAASYFGVLFLKGRISLKNGTYCPFLASIQPFSKARVFLLS